MSSCRICKASGRARIIIVFWSSFSSPDLPCAWPAIDSLPAICVINVQLSACFIISCHLCLNFSIFRGSQSSVLKLATSALCWNLLEMQILRAHSRNSEPGPHRLWLQSTRWSRSRLDFVESGVYKLQHTRWFVTFWFAQKETAPAPAAFCRWPRRRTMASNRGQWDLEDETT